MTDKSGGKKSVRQSQRGIEEGERKNGRVMQSEPESGSSRLPQPRFDPALSPHPVNLPHPAAMP